MAVAAALVLSCAKERVRPNPNGDTPQIAFGSGITEEDTRATPVTGTALGIGSSYAFRVYSFRLPASNGGTTPGTPANAIGQYMPNDLQVYYNSATTTTYSSSNGINTWPPATNDCLMFYACYPYSIPSGTLRTITVPSGACSNPQMQVTYETSLDPSQQYDLMYAGTNALYRTVVPLQFRHALTRVTFTAILAEPSQDNAVVKVRRLVLRPVRSKGTLTVTNGNASWALSTGEYDNVDLDLSINAAEYAGNGRLANVVVNETTPVQILPTNGDLMLLPQAVDNMELDIELSVQKTVGGQPVTVMERNYLMLPADKPWESGKHIEYELFIARNIIYIGVYINRWQTEGVNGPYTAGQIAGDGGVITLEN